MTLEYKITEMLLPFRLTWKNRATSDLIWAVRLVAEDANRIDAVDKEVYAVIAKARCCTWRGIESNIRRAMEQAWKHNRGYGSTTAVIWRPWQAIRWMPARRPQSSSTSAPGPSPGSRPQRI